MMNRVECFKVISRHVRDRDVVVSSYSSAFEWIALRPPGLTYVAVGAMGLDTSHSLGFALAMPGRRIITLQGDGSLMMNLGSLATLADQAPNNVIHITCRNMIYEANGGHPIPNGGAIDFQVWRVLRASGAFFPSVISMILSEISLKPLQPLARCSSASTSRLERHPCSIMKSCMRPISSRDCRQISRPPHRATANPDRQAVGLSVRIGSRRRPHSA